MWPRKARYSHAFSLKKTIALLVGMAISFVKKLTMRLPARRLPGDKQVLITDLNETQKSIDGHWKYGLNG